MKRDEVKNLIGSAKDVMPSVAVVGAGMAGLSAAYRLRQAGWKVTVFECEDEVGGRTRSFREKGYLFDLGAITLSPAYRETIALLNAVGAGESLCPVRPKLAIARGGQLHEIDLAKPLRSLLAMRLLSRSSVLRLGRLLPGLLRVWSRCDFEGMSKLSSLDNESSRAFALRTLGAEAHDYLVDPLIRVNMFTSTDVSSVVDLFWLLRVFASTTIVQVTGGMGSMSRAIAATMDVRMGMRIASVHEVDGGVLVRDDAGREFHFDRAVVATPPPIAFAIAPAGSGALGQWLAAVEPVRSLTVQVGLRRRPASAAAMVMVPTVEEPELLAIGLDHNKSPDRAPSGRGIATLHFSEPFAEASRGMSDEEIVHTAIGAAGPIIGITLEDVDAWHIHRWDYVDHKRRPGVYKTLAKAEADHQQKTILFAGEYRSAGVEGAVISGRRCAEILEAGRPGPGHP